jgi:hypothetical protein
MPNPGIPAVAYSGLSETPKAPFRGQSKEKSMEKSALTRLAIAGIMAGGFLLTGCENGTSSQPAASNGTGITAAKTLAAFQTECSKLGGTFKAHDCSGQNECKGHSFQEGKDVAAHDCAGHSSCQGGSCIES